MPALGIPSRRMKSESRPHISDQTIWEAITALQQKKFKSARETARQFEIPWDWFHRALKLVSPSPPSTHDGGDSNALPTRDVPKTLAEFSELRDSVGRPRNLPPDLETVLVERVLRLAELGHPITIRILQDKLARMLTNNSRG